MGNGGDHNGQRLARARLRRRWTQERLARESGFSLATVRAVEQGRRSLDNMGQLLTFARALEVPVTDLTGQPYTPSSPEQDAGQGAVAGIRRELLLAEREPMTSDAQAAAVSITGLRGRVEDMSGRHRSAALDAARAGDAAAMSERWERAHAIGEQIGQDHSEPLASGRATLPSDRSRRPSRCSTAPRPSPAPGASTPSSARWSRPRRSRAAAIHGSGCPGIGSTSGALTITGLTATVLSAPSWRRSG